TFSAVTMRHRFLAARVACVAVFLFATLADLQFSGNLDDARLRLIRAFTPALGWRDAVDGLRNTVLSAGIGMVWVMTSLTGDLPGEIPAATVVALTAAVAVEALQVFSPVRTASLIDVATNTLGGFVGAGATVFLLAAVQKARHDKSYLGIPAFIVAG